MTLELEVPNFKICVVCQKKFFKPFNSSSQTWRVRKSCSNRCQMIRRRSLDNTHFKTRPGIIRDKNNRRHYIYVFQCSLCGEEIEGSKRNVKQHKYEKHGH